MQKVSENNSAFPVLSIKKRSFMRHRGCFLNINYADFGKKIVFFDQSWFCKSIRIKFLDEFKSINIIKIFRKPQYKCKRNC